MLTVEKRNSKDFIYGLFLIIFILYFNIKYCSLKTEDIVTSENNNQKKNKS